MSGELRVVTSDGKNYWFGRDERFPREVRVYGGSTHTWEYLPTDQVRGIVREALDQGGETQQGDPVLFFREDDGRGQTTG